MDKRQKAQLLKAIQDGTASINSLKPKLDFRKLSVLELRALLQYIRYDGNTHLMIPELRALLPNVLEFVQGKGEIYQRSERKVERFTWDMHQRIHLREKEAEAMGLTFRRA